MYLVEVHRDTKLVVKLQWLGPDHPPKPEAVAAVSLLSLCGDVQDVLFLVQWAHMLAYKNTLIQEHDWLTVSSRYSVYVLQSVGLS